MSVCLPVWRRDRSVFDLAVQSNWLDNSSPMGVILSRMSLQSALSVSNLLELLCYSPGGVDTFEFVSASQSVSQSVSPHHNRIQILLVKIDSDHFFCLIYGFFPVKS